MLGIRGGREKTTEDKYVSTACQLVMNTVMKCGKTITVLCSVTGENPDCYYRRRKSERAKMKYMEHKCHRYTPSLKILSQKYSWYIAVKKMVPKVRLVASSRK